MPSKYLSLNSVILMILSVESEFSFSEFIHLLFTAFLARRELHTLRGGSCSVSSDVRSEKNFIIIIIIIIIIITLVSVPWNILYLEKLIMFQFPALSFMEYKFLCHRPMAQDQPLTGKNPVHASYVITKYPSVRSCQSGS
jgi:CBS domain containing-hemolysin-like protein